MKCAFLILIGVFFIAACSSSSTRSVPSATLDGLSILTSGKSAGLPADFKHQVAISGNVIRDITCFTDFTRLRIELNKAHSTDPSICDTVPKENGFFDLVCVAEVGDYSINLLNSLTGKRLQTKPLHTDSIDRFEIQFDACPSAGGPGLD